MQAPGKITVPVETASQVKARQPAGTLKRVIFDALEAAGEQGLSTAELAELVQVNFFWSQFDTNSSTAQNIHLSLAIVVTCALIKLSFGKLLRILMDFKRQLKHFQKNLRAWANSNLLSVNQLVH